MDELTAKFVNLNIVKSKYVQNIKLYKVRETITPSFHQTKNWRKSQSWYEGGKKNECEIYQRKLINTITNQECCKCNDRINLESNEIVSQSRPMTLENAFDWTEDFDGKQCYTGTPNITLYYNLKMICDAGGAQTRSLREVAHFVKAQLDYKLTHLSKLTYFVNILDGDECNKLYSKYEYILKKEKYKHVRHFVYVGDLYGFVYWFNSLNVQ